MEFRATCDTCSVDNDIATLGFADDEFNTTQYLLLQRKLSPDDQDRALRMDRLHIEYCEQSQSAYGSVIRAELGKQRLVLHFDRATADAVSNGEAIEIAFVANAPKPAELFDQLSLLVGRD